MINQKFCTFGHSAALQHAASVLWSKGWEYDASASILLLPVPSFDSEGRVIGGGRIEDVLTKETIVIGGGLGNNICNAHSTIDLLHDPFYLAQNAAITAHCAVRIALEQLKRTLDGCPVLVIGWGRIGKCLADLLRRMGANVAVSARKETDLALLAALGYQTVQVPIDTQTIKNFKVIFNTVPTSILSKSQLCSWQLKIDLASIRGIEGDDVIHARGLPGIYAPESSGLLIAQAVDRLGKELFI